MGLFRRDRAAKPLQPRKPPPPDLAAFVTLCTDVLTGLESDAAVRSALRTFADAGGARPFEESIHIFASEGITTHQLPWQWAASCIEQAYIVQDWAAIAAGTALMEQFHTQISGRMGMADRMDVLLDDIDEPIRVDVATSVVRALAPVAPRSVLLHVGEIPVDARSVMILASRLAPASLLPADVTAILAAA